MRGVPLDLEVTSARKGDFEMLAPFWQPFTVKKFLTRVLTAKGEGFRDRRNSKTTGARGIQLRAFDSARRAEQSAGTLGWWLLAQAGRNREKGPKNQLNRVFSLSRGPRGF